MLLLRALIDCINKLKKASNILRTALLIKQGVISELIDNFEKILHENFCETFSASKARLKSLSISMEI